MPCVAPGVSHSSHFTPHFRESVLYNQQVNDYQLRRLMFATKQQRLVAPAAGCQSSTQSVIVLDDQQHAHVAFGVVSFLALLF